MNTAAKSNNYQVLINQENIWLKRNRPGFQPIKIGKFIGASKNCSIISEDEKYVLIGGYGLMVINIDNFFNGLKGNPEQSIMICFREKENKFWINKIWQDKKNNKQTFCFISKLKQYCFNIENGNIIKIDDYVSPSLIGASEKLII